MSNLPDGPWSVLQGEYDERPMLVRLNSGARAVARSADLAHRIGVAVPLLSPDDDGLPTASENAALVGIEDALCESLCAGAEVVLTVIITTSGMREFVFYCSMPANVPPAIASVRERFPTYEIQLVEESDPEWKVYDQLASA
jgi:hypothetical protein